MEVLIFDDDTESANQIAEITEGVLTKRGIDYRLNIIDKWDDLFEVTENWPANFDLIISDTYRDSKGTGTEAERDAAVKRLVDELHHKCLCPILLCSSFSEPEWLETSLFLRWCDKTKTKDLVASIDAVLASSVPQSFSSIREEITQSGSNYVWNFFSENWKSLSNLDQSVLDRLIRRRISAVILNDIANGTVSEAELVDCAEYYHYPSLASERISLGEIIRNNNDHSDLRVVLTPHCYLFVQDGQKAPRASHILTVRLFEASKLSNAWDPALKEAKSGNTKKLKNITKADIGSSASKVKPDGRIWFFPAFIDIPNSYADFLRVESLPYINVIHGFTRLATLTPPFAENLQQSFGKFYANIGLPSLRVESILNGGKNTEE